MKIVVGGSYHNPNWNEVKKVIELFEKAGHEVIAPGSEWEPINIEDSYVRFKGEEETSIQELQTEFYRKILEDADAFVIVNKDGYLGSTATNEVLYASVINLTNTRRYPIYFTETPTIVKVFDDIPEHISIFGLKTRFIGPDELREKLLNYGLDITQEEYDELCPFHCKLFELMNNYPGMYVIGIDNLLEKKDNKVKHKCQE